MQHGWIKEKLHFVRSSKNWVAYKQVGICIRQLKTD
jgi:hypothetical protein